MQSDTRIRPSDSAIWENLGGELVLMNTKTLSMFSLNRTGTAIWLKITEGASIDEIISAIAAEFSISKGRALEDVQDLVSELHKKGLLEEDMHRTV